MCLGLAAWTAAFTEGSRGANAMPFPVLLPDSRVYFAGDAGKCDRLGDGQLLGAKPGAAVRLLPRQG